MGCTNIAYNSSFLELPVNVLYYKFIILTSTVAISPLNIIIWIGIYFVARFVKKAIKVYISKKNIQTQQITLAGKEITLVSLSKQIVNILFVIFALQSLSITNNGSGLKELLDIKLLETSKFNLTVYNVFFITILVVAAKLLSTFARLFIQRNLAGKQWIDKGREYTFTMVVKYFIYTIITVIALNSLGIDITLVVASSAALLVGLGLGIQKIFADIISGFIILFEGSIKVGDIVQLNEGQARIVQINIRTSKARTVDGNTIIIPNSRLTTENVNHRSFNNKPLRYSVSIYVSPESNTAQVKQLLYDCLLSHTAVDKRKNIMILLEEFTDTNQQYKMVFWTDKVWEVDVIKSDLRYAADETLRKNGIACGTPNTKYVEREKNTPIN